MLHLLLIYVIFTILVFVKYRKAITTWFLFLMLAGWFLSLAGLLLYVSRMNEYYYIINRYFNVNRGLWRYLMLLDIDPSNSIRLINLGVLLFIFSFTCFSLKFTNVKKNYTKLFLGLSIFLILELIFYDPLVYKIFYIYLFNRSISILSFEQFNLLIKVIYIITFVVNKLYVIISILNLLIYSLKEPKISFLKNYVLIVIVCIIPVSVIHTLMFSWVPKILTNVSTLANYISYLNLEAFVMEKLYSDIFQIVVIISFVAITSTILKFNVIEYYFKQKDIHISRSINTANLGINVFSHMVKNRLICILAEADEIIRLENANSEIFISANNIINICRESINNINTLSSKFKSISLDFQLIPISVPVEKALSSFQTIPENIKLLKEYIDNVPVCFLDNKHMTEVIINLLNNSIEAIGDKEGTIEISIEGGEKWGIISLSDTGYGIAQENIKKIFDPFFSTKPTSSNWGVGLSYCYKIISAHEGKLLVNSIPSKGTTFKILIPTIS